ncbi:hypothetical protein C2I18_17620 [Paenibacillus sp. PK3_47]|uniref:hypothetical protein n=1 Tax=Paenibacillus sp. PK3_47 TaxID=2072642 RepID=UPI00201E5382|nr:hypothetical protein [Paenibacillus sp. PK3_47]UQZ35181.1 hypothetical protein C2I18_17620 [Paenibacillus sp. PK3_47]
MYTVKGFIHLALAAAILLLPACSSAQDAAPDATAAPAGATDMPQTAPPASPEVSAPRESQPPAAAEPTAQAEPDAPEEPVEGQPPTALESASTVLNALANSNMDTLSSWVHPDKGVRFSPYAYVDPQKDLVFTREEIQGLMKDNTKRVWREYAGSGDLIELTFAEYFKKFVYDADFAGQAEVALNKGLGQGTTVNNINEVYPVETHDFVEYHIAGIDPAVEGMDWRSLRLVFEKIGQDHALVGIVHDQWTP